MGSRIFIVLGFVVVASLAGALLGTVPKTGKTALAAGAPEDLVCRGPFRYSTLVLDSAGNGKLGYQLRVRFSKAAEAAAEGQNLQSGECGWPGRAMATQSGKAEAEMTASLQVTEVSVVFHLDETSRATVTRAAHPYQDFLVHAGVAVLSVAEVEVDGEVLYSFAGDVGLR